MKSVNIKYTLSDVESIHHSKRGKLVKIIFIQKCSVSRWLMVKMLLLFFSSRRTGVTAVTTTLIFSNVSLYASSIFLFQIPLCPWNQLKGYCKSFILTHFSRQKWSLQLISQVQIVILLTTYTEKALQLLQRKKGCDRVWNSWSFPEAVLCVSSF